jgi:diadenosine tetraphosphatase ApaH/serine/threonine PP2A family protein phosphatase
MVTKFAKSSARYAILGDIHSNVEALDVVLADARARGCTHYACVGDVVGYNASPRECIDRIRELKCVTVRGNHDHYCAVDEKLDGFHPLAADVVNWTRKTLTAEQIAYLRELPYRLPVETFTLVHSTLDTPEMWGYVFDKFEADANFNYQSTAVCFFGHTHVPLAFEKTNEVRFGLYDRIKITLGRKYFINVGSVGQPRDGDPRAAYATYDLKTGEVELHRLEYDIPGAQRRILAAGLPERLAQRLALGR